MRTTLHTLHTPLLLALLRDVGDVARRLWRQARQWRRMRQAHAALSGLDDRTLRDLGIGRSEIPSIAANPGDAHRVRVMTSIFAPGNGR